MLANNHILLYLWLMAPVASGRGLPAFIYCFVLAVFLAGNAASQAPYGYHFIRTDQNPAAVIYDSVHQQFFVSVPEKNEIEDVSGIDGSQVARISVTGPTSMDLSPDGHLLYVTNSLSYLHTEQWLSRFFVVDAE